MADLDAASLRDVREWFRDKYGPNNAVVVVAAEDRVAAAAPPDAVVAVETADQITQGVPERLLSLPLPSMIAMSLLLLGPGNGSGDYARTGTSAL